MKTILYWNTFFGSENMGLGLGRGAFSGCPVSACTATSNKSLLPVEEFDAIVFHGPRFTARADRVPTERSLHQKYIFLSLESPYNTQFDGAVTRDFYNWTMTYRRDSDIHYPYRIIQEIVSNYTPPTYESFRQKRNMVAWFVSNCATPGSLRRMKYARELSKFIQVDVYGLCGNLTCSIENRWNCYGMLELDYKFYLSFENSMCPDYVTEKLFNILTLDVVPVVLGYAEYGSIAPPR